jgi:hypothetical protein
VFSSRSGHTQLTLLNIFVISLISFKQQTATASVHTLLSSSFTVNLEFDITGI